MISVKAFCLTATTYTVNGPHNTTVTLNTAMYVGITMPKIGFSENDYMPKNFCLGVVELDSVV